MAQSTTVNGTSLNALRPAEELDLKNRPPRPSILVYEITQTANKRGLHVVLTPMHGINQNATQLIRSSLKFKLKTLFLLDVFKFSFFFK